MTPREQSYIIIYLPWADVFWGILSVSHQREGLQTDIILSDRPSTVDTYASRLWLRIFELACMLSWKPEFR
jgi:hypothetical protein